MGLAQSGPVISAHPIGKKTQWSFFRHARIQLSQCASGGVARIDELFFARVALTLIQRFKIFFKHDHFAADFNQDSVIDFFDYLDFVDAFSTGCSL